MVGEAVEEQQDENVANPLCLAEARTRDEEQEETAARLRSRAPTADFAEGRASCLSTSAHSLQLAQ